MLVNGDDGELSAIGSGIGSTKNGFLASNTIAVPVSFSSGDIPQRALEFV